jgi:hypothetical protein
MHAVRRGLRFRHCRRWLLRLRISEPAYRQSRCSKPGGRDSNIWIHIPAGFYRTIRDDKMVFVHGTEPLAALGFTAGCREHGHKFNPDLQRRRAGRRRPFQGPCAGGAASTSVSYLRPVLPVYKVACGRKSNIEKHSRLPEQVFRII